MRQDDIYWLLYASSRSAVFAKLSDRTARPNKRVRLWEVHVDKEPYVWGDGRTTRFDIVLHEFDCANESYSTLQQSAFDAVGRSVRSWQPEPNTTFIRPGTNGELAMYFACMPQFDPARAGMQPVDPSFDEPRFLVGFANTFVFKGK